MAEKAGDLYVEMAVDADKMDEAMVRVRKKAEESGRASEAAFRAQWSKHGEQLAARLSADGKNAGKRLAKTLQEEYQREIARGKALRFEGAIDTDEMRRRARQAARAFNTALSSGLQTLKASNVISQTELDSLTRRLKTAGFSGGKGFGDSMRQGAEGGFRSILTYVRGIFLIQVARIISRIGSEVTQKLRESVTAAESQIQSYARLNAAAQLFNVSQTELVSLAENARSEYQLTATVANDLAVQTTKLANRAGMAAQSQELLARALDLGAANGADASRIALALDQTLRGVDEGTDLLLGKNPSQVFAEYAASIGKTAGALTDMEQKQALVNALMDAGTKVAGAYGELISGQLGPLTRWRVLQQETSESIGRALLPLLGKVAAVLEGPLTKGVDMFIGFLDRLDRMSNSPLENLIKDLREAGDQSARLAGLQAMIERDRLKNERAALARESQFIVNDPRLGQFGGLGRESRRRLDAGLGQTTVIGGRDLREVSAEELSKEIAQVDDELSDLALKAVGAGEVTDDMDAQREALGRYRTRLRDVLDLREREKEIADDLIVAERVLADVREGRATTEKADEPTTDPIEPPDPAVLAEIKRLRDQAAGFREEMETALAGLTATAMDEALIQLDRLEADAREVFSRLGEALPDELARGLESRRESILQAGQLEEFARELDTLAAARVSPQSLAVLREYVDRLGDYIEAHGDANGALAEGTKLREQYNNQLRRGQQQLDANEKAIRSEAEEARRAAEEAAESQRRSAEERIRALRDTARTLEEAARGALQLAEAFGVIGSEAGRALQNVVQLGTAAYRLAGGDLTALPVAIGAAAGLISGLRGRGAEEERRSAEAQKAMLEQLDKNRQALDENTAAIAGSRTVGAITAGEAASGNLGGRLSSMGPRFRTNMGDVAVSNLEFVKKLLADPESRNLMREVFEATGIDLLSAAETSVSVGDNWALAFNQAWAAAQEILDQSAQEFGRIADSNVAGQMARFRQELDLLDLDSASDQLDHFIVLLRRIGAGGFADQLQSLLGSGDLDGARDLVRTIFQDLVTGNLTASEVGGLFGEGASSDTVRQILSDVNAWLEDMVREGGGVVGGAQDTRLSVSITEVQASQLLAYQSTQVYHLAAIHALLAGRQLPDPIAAPVAALASSTRNVQTVNVAAPQITINAGGDAGDREAWQVAGRSIGVGIRQSFTEQLHAAWRGAGGSGIGGRIEVEVRGSNR